MKSKFTSKLNNKLNHRIYSDIEALLSTAHSLNSFDTIDEFKEYLSEGATININSFASNILSIPRGEYIVLSEDSRRIILTLSDNLKILAENSKDDYEYFEISTPKLLSTWNSIEKIISEADEDDEDTEDEPKSRKEKSSVRHIDMATVNRSPIVKAMEQNGYTVTSLADAVGVDPPAISRLLRKPKKSKGRDPGGRNPSIELAAKISNKLKLDAESMFPDIFKNK